MKKELICFDLDNTLVKADNGHIKSFNKAFLENGLRKVKGRKLKRLFGIPGRFIVKKLFPNLSRRKVLKIADDHDEFLIKEDKRYIKKIHNANKILKRLKIRYKLALVSNCKKIEINAVLKEVKINRGLFNVIIGHDEVKRHKPSPDMILKAKSLLKVDKGYMIGDSVYDIKAGKRAGLKTIGVLTGNFSRRELEQVKADYIIKDINYVEKVLNG